MSENMLEETAYSRAVDHAEIERDAMIELAYEEHEQAWQEYLPHKLLLAKKINLAHQNFAKAQALAYDEAMAEYERVQRKHTQMWANLFTSMGLDVVVVERGEPSA